MRGFRSSEKGGSKTGNLGRTRYRLGAIVALQHVLLSGALYVVASEVYLLVAGAVTTGLIPTAALLMASVSS